MLLRTTKCQLVSVNMHFLQPPCYLFLSNCRLIDRWRSGPMNYLEMIHFQSEMVPRSTMAHFKMSVEGVKTSKQEEGV